MDSTGKINKPLQAIEESSPLYAFWQSQQREEDEKQRLAKSSKTFAAAELYKKEPYKWEMLYQSIVREIYKGDLNSIKGLKLLITMLTKQEQNKIIEHLSTKKVLKQDILERLNDDMDKSETKKNPIRFIKILLAIFTNPYCIEMKTKKIHIYEKTGSMFFKLRKLF